MLVLRDVCDVACAAEALKPQASWWQQLATCQLGVAQCQEALGRYDAAIQQCDLVASTAQKAAGPQRLLVDAHLCRFRVREQYISALAQLLIQLLIQSSLHVGIVTGRLALQYNPQWVWTLCPSTRRRHRCRAGTRSMR